MARMKMVTIYTVTTPAPLLNGRPSGNPTQWRGDCAGWAAAARRDGLTVTEQRVALVGKKWVCSTCAQGFKH